MNDKRIWGIIGGLALVLALLSPYVLGSTKKVERLFEAAETLYEQNDYKGAIEKYNEALKESKKLRARTETIDQDFTTLVNFKIAMSYVQLAEYEKALEYIEKAAQTVKLPEYEEQLTYQWGYIFYKIERLEQALEKFAQLVEKFPNSPLVEKAQETITQINAQLQGTDEDINGVDPRDALPWINDFSKFEAFNKERNQRLVVPNRLRAEKRYPQAGGEYETFAIDYPTTKQAAYALYWAGFCYSPDSTTILSDKSIAIFRKLINNHPESLYAAKAREKLNSIPVPDNLDEAIHKAEEAVQQLKALNCESPAVVTAERRLIDAKQQKARNNYEAAYQSANDAEELAKNTIEDYKKAEKYIEKGYARLQQGELSRSKANVDAARRAHPSYPKIRELSAEIERRIERKNNHFSGGVAHFENRAYTKAIDSFTKALEIDSQFKEAYYRLGAAYLKNGEFECALACAKKALDIDPNYQDASDLIDSIDTDALNGECEHNIP